MARIHRREMLRNKGYTVQQSNLKLATIKALVWKLLEQGGTAVVTLVVQIVMARLLAPSEFGALAIMLVFVNIGNVLVRSGLNTALIQNPDVTERDCSTVFWMCLTTSTVLYVAIFCTAPAIAAFYAMPQIIWPLRLLVLVLVINAYNSIQEAIVSRELAYQKTARATIIAGLISGFVGIVVALMGFGLWALVVQQVLQQLCRCVVLALQVPWKPQLVFERDRAITLFRFGWKLLVSGVIDQIYQSLSDLIIGKMFTKEQLGFVSQGKKYPYYLGVMLDGVIQPVMLSTVSQVQKDVERAKRLVRRALKTSTFIIVPSMAAFAVAAHPIVRVLLGDKWLPCVPFLQMYCVVYAIRPIHTTNLQALNGMGRSDYFLKIEITKKIIGLSLLTFNSFVLRNVYAIVAGNVVLNLISTFINAYPNKRVINYAYGEQLWDIAPSLLLAAAGIAAATPLAWIGLPSLACLIVQILTLFVVYFVLARVFHVEEFAYLIDTLRELRTRNAS